MKTKYTLAALIVALLTAAGTGFAAEAQDDAWKFGVSVPLWAPSIDGTATLRGHTEDVSIGFSTLRDHLDASFGIALEARKGPLGFYTDFGYMKFSGDGHTAGNGDNASSTLKFIVGNAGMSYVLVKKGEEHPFILAGTVGIRYWYTSTDLTLKDSAGDTLFSGGQDRNLEQAVIGLRGSQFLSRKVHLDFSGDIGGFNISHNTDWTWSAAGLLTYDPAKWFSISGGYKALGVDESDGSGANKHGLNLTFHGPAIVAKFIF